jgi:hypothetical protein
MKYTIVVLVAIFGAAMAGLTEKFDWETIPEVKNTSQCVYLPGLKRLSCRSEDRIISCDAVMEKMEGLKYEVFGLGRVISLEEEEKMNVDEIKYYLYPRHLENSTYLNRTIEIDGEMIDLFVYFDEEPVESGIRVTSLKCYKRLVKMFDLTTVEHVPVIDGEEREECTLFGEVLVLDKEAHKRWFGGLWGGLGLWSPWLWGFGFWGRK